MENDNLKIEANPNGTMTITIKEFYQARRVGTNRFTVSKLIINKKFYIESILKLGFNEGRLFFYNCSKEGVDFHWGSSNKKFKRLLKSKNPELHLNRPDYQKQFESKKRKKFNKKQAKTKLNLELELRRFIKMGEASYTQSKYDSYLALSRNKQEADRLTKRMLDRVKSIINLTKAG